MHAHASVYCRGQVRPGQAPVPVTSSLLHRCADRMNLSTFEREASIREEARRKQEAEDEALARRILAQEHEEEAARQAGSRGTGSRRASAAATMAGNGSSPYTSGGPSTSSSHRHMSTYTESNNLLGSQPGRAGATEQRVMQTVQSAPREGMRAAQEAYHQYRGYGQMVPDTAGGSYGAGGAELAHYRQGSGVSHTTHTSSTSAVRRYSAPAGSTALARAGAAGGSSGMYGDHRAFVEEEGRVRGDTFAQLDEEQFAQSTLARGVSEDAGLSWADFDLLFRPLLIHGFTLIKHGKYTPCASSICLPPSLPPCRSTRVCHLLSLPLTHSLMYALQDGWGHPRHDASG